MRKEFFLSSSGMVLLLAAIAAALLVIERLWPANELPTSRGWWLRVALINSAQVGVIILASFYKHPVEITINSLISATLTYVVLGISIEAAALYPFPTAISEYFYHWNIRTPRWLGPIFQRPESHRVHHQYLHHTRNFADLPIWDILFRTYHNPVKSPAHCGFDEEREGNFTTAATLFIGLLGSLQMAGHALGSRTLRELGLPLLADPKILIKACEGEAIPNYQFQLR